MNTLTDINISFSRNLVNNAVSSVSGKRAVSQIISDLISTQTMEIPFKEWQGSALMSLLGEACSNLTASVIAEQIRTLIVKYVPYVEIQDIQYVLDPDNQRYLFTLYYNLVRSTEIIEQTLTLSVII